MLVDDQAPRVPGCGRCILMAVIWALPRAVADSRLPLTTSALSGLGSGKAHRTRPAGAIPQGRRELVCEGDAGRSAQDEGRSPRNCGQARRHAPNLTRGLCIAAPPASARGHAPRPLPGEGRVSGRREAPRAARQSRLAPVSSRPPINRTLGSPQSGCKRAPISDGIPPPTAATGSPTSPSVAAAPGVGLPPSPPPQDMA